MSKHQLPADGLSGLTEAQHDGLACVVCGDEHGPKIPIDGIRGKHGSQLFRCVRCRVDIQKLKQQTEEPQ